MPGVLSGPACDWKELYGAIPGSSSLTLVRLRLGRTAEVEEAAGFGSGDGGR